MKHKLVIGTRGSALALWQAHHVRDRLTGQEPGLEVELDIIKTKGDKIQDVPLSKVGGKGLFVKEIEQALVDARIDLAVHSMKDVPAELQDGCVMAAVSRREDPRDVLVTRTGGGLDSLPEGARVGTSSLRRSCQLLARRPDLRIGMLRGNVDTRLGKLDQGDLDAIVLAAAGLKRLGHADRISELLPPEICLPAIGQGALGLETRADDRTSIDRVKRAMHDADTADCVALERALMLALMGNCQTPMACYAQVEGDELVADGLVADPDDGRVLRESIRGPRADAVTLGKRLADELKAQGAEAILGKLRARAH